MNLSIAPLSESQFEQLREVLDTVARERRYLALLQAPPPERSFAFYRSLLAEGQCHVALDGTRVVGWCDIQPAFGETRRHTGTLGMGLLPECRHRGVGSRLLAAAIATAWSRGLSRIELTVREDNLNAKALYERLGFQHEGIKRQSMRVDGRFYDCHAMALLRQHGN
jgi:ribosomal protein S18 acetylase RimI-like enzyme